MNTAFIKIEAVGGFGLYTNDGTLISVDRNMRKLMNKATVRGLTSVKFVNG